MKHLRTWLYRLAKSYISDVRSSANVFSGVGGANGSSSSPTNLAAAAAPPVVLLGNKADMVHLRQVATEEGEEKLRRNF